MLHEIRFPSSNDRDQVTGWIYVPACEPEGIVQLVHGFGEHSRRYFHMIVALMDAGFIVAADDHVGHGATAIANGTWGDWGDAGPHTMMEDEKRFKDLVCEKYPDLPYFLFGHSMGSMIARDFSAKYGDELAGAVYCGTTGIFKKDGREFVFVPGDTVTLGWEQFAVGLNQESREELEYLFREWEMEPQNPEEMIRESMAPVRQAAIGPMLVGRELEEINWEPVKMNDPRLTAHPDWLKEFRDFAWSDSSSLTLHQSARIERTEDGFQTWIYNRTDYDELLAMLENRGFSLPTADEWAYLCGGGCRTLFPWGDGLDYSMRLRWFEDMDEDENRPYDMEEPNFFGLSIAYDPYMREVVQADRLTTCGGDGGCNICGGLGPFLGFLPCSPHCKPEVQEDNELNGDYDFYRPIIRLENHD